MAWKNELDIDGIKVMYKVEKKICSIQSQFQKIEIFDTADQGKLMLIDGIVMLTEKNAFTYHEMITHVPIFSHKNPKNVLIIGGGDGGVVTECLKYNYIENIDLCEIDKEVISASKKHLSFIAKSLNHKKVNVLTENGLNYLKNCKKKYDIIIADGTDPIGPGTVLFTEKFFSLVKSRLQPNGIYCSQCETPFNSFGKIMPKVNTKLLKMFNEVKFFGASVPMYPSGYWAFVIASDRKIFLDKKRCEDETKSMKLDYYNHEIHTASFVLPNFFKKKLKNK